ncbi:MAG: cation transport protein ChaC [Saprospiraceae bacterium]|jgi:cation transport protein ChaC
MENKPIGYPDFSGLVFDHTQHPSIEVPEGDVWFFGYGSLMWRPEFDYLDSVSARLYGYHRALCLWSIEYRGDVTQPGLVLGLDRGGSCLGRAFKICATQIDEILPQLNRREMITGAYQSIIKPIYLASGEKVQAVSLVARHGHTQYVTPPLTDAQTAEVLQKAKGKMGPNIDYVLNTVSHLRELGIKDVTLERVANQLAPNG